jgi:osmotically-inducible protein OsmY
MKNNRLKVLVLGAAMLAVLAGGTGLLYAAQQESAPMMTTQSQTDASVQQAIQGTFNNDLNFAETNLTATVTDDTVVLSGNARDVRDHLKALDTAKSLADGRRIVDNTTIQEEYRRNW